MVQSTWYQTWFYDPEVSILLNPSSSGGDGGDNSNLAYIALVAIVLAPIAVIVVIAVGVVFFVAHRQRARRKFSTAVERISAAKDEEASSASA